MRFFSLLFAGAIFTTSSAGLASTGSTGSKYYVVLTDVMGASASEFSGPYSSRAACQSDEKTFQSREKSPVAVYVCEPRKKAEIDKMTDKERQALEQNRLNVK